MDLRALEYFVAVAEEGSFTAAAARCRVAQPSVSQQIKRLEHELGESLFDRDARRAGLSPGGAVLLPYARACLAAADAARSEFAARSGLLTGELRLGTVAGVEETRIPELLGTFHERYPGVAVTLTGGTTAPLLARVRQGALNAAVIAAPREPLPPAIGSRLLLRDEIVAVTQAGPSVEGRSRSRSATIGELADRPIITYAPDSGLHSLIVDALSDAGRTVGYATNDVALHVALARQGVGTALSAGSDPALRHPGVRARPLRPALRYEKLLVWRRGQPLGAPLRAFLAVWDELIPPAGQADAADGDAASTASAG